MTELIVILIGTVFVNNFVLVRFLGLCPFMGVSRNLEAAAGMSLATAFVLTLSSATAFLLHRYVLVPLELEYLRTIGFILVIAASVQFTEIMVRRLSPLLNQVLGIYIPLIATNCAVLGVALLNVHETVCFLHVEQRHPEHFESVIKPGVQDQLEQWEADPAGRQLIQNLDRNNLETLVATLAASPVSAGCSRTAR